MTVPVWKCEATAVEGVPPDFLTIILTLDPEKGLPMAQRFFTNLRLLNADATRKIQIIAIDQTRNGDYQHLCQSQNLWVDYHRAHCPFVGDIPIWDVLDDTRRVWHLVRGEYVMFCHPEFFYMPGDLARTLVMLAKARPILALGNLRRLVGSRTMDQDPTRGERLNTMLDNMEHMRFFADVLRHGHSHWIYWLQPPQDDGKWVEDIFYVRRDFLETTKFLHWGGPQPFQDVYDLVQNMHMRLRQYGCAYRVTRLSLAVNMVFHLWHSRPWSYCTPEVRDWFLSDPMTWNDTTGLREDLWNAMIDIKEGRRTDDRPVSDFRQAPGGTVTRWAVDFCTWLQDGGADEMRAYYAATLKGEDMPERVKSLIEGK